VQPQPVGLAQAFLIGADFLGGDAPRWSAATTSSTAWVSAGSSSATPSWSAPDLRLHVADPQADGVVEFDAAGTVVS
jgi:glucose-1-phosphate thymidylyltransferase